MKRLLSQWWGFLLCHLHVTGEHIYLSTQVVEHLKLCFVILLNSFLTVTGNIPVMIDTLLYLFLIHVSVILTYKGDVHPFEIHAKGRHVLLSFVETGQVPEIGRPNYLIQGRLLSRIYFARKVLS